LKIGVIGAGPSGLSLGMFLEHDTEVLEARSFPGGHASSIELDGYTFDNGPHLMVSRDQALLDFMVRSLGDNVHRCRRNNKIAIAGRLTKYPFENDLASLPPELSFACARDYFINPSKALYPEPANLREWFLHHFGEAMSEAYFFPYNEKVWNVPIDQLSMLWADRIPQPPPEDILKSAMGIATEGYMHQLDYHYPLRGGYQAISEAWAARVKPTYDFPVDRIRHDGNELVVSSAGRERRFDRVVSTVPLSQLVRIVGFEIPDAVREAVDRLTVNPMLAVSLGVSGTDEEQMTAVYFAEREFKVNRVSFPATFSPLNAPKGHYSIQAEITCRPDDPTWSWTDEQAISHVVGGLVDAGLLADAEDVRFSHVERIEYAYVVYERGYEQHAAVVREWFPRMGIELCGRFSFFEYVNVDGAVARAMALAQQMNGRPVDLAAAAQN
jgi:protoporphyrinogen oxidase